MRSSGRGRHAPSFVARLRARLRFRRDVPVRTDDRVSHPSASASRHTLTSTSTLTLTLTSTSPDPHHSRDQRSSHHSNCGPQPASPITLPPQSLDRIFQFPAFFLKRNSEKAGGLIFLDTGARVNLISSDMVGRLGLCRQRISPRKLVPFYSGLKEKTELTVEYQVQVDWHFENGERTYTTEFLVIDMPCYDILLGCDEIRKNELLTLGSESSKKADRSGSTTVYLRRCVTSLAPSLPNHRMLCHLIFLILRVGASCDTFHNLLPHSPPPFGVPVFSFSAWMGPD
ncbi:retropepsin-like aspartic protease [Aspergillus novofumigatus IBT 16806]|uniref:Uncharacterized protein n=1 Tax=Aspergillus novofumigatus (strain IBT 16806) TaxID=1392255 RepID=A0A2I1CPM2_ASPN1|nr:uncharacterized protein P174DRAFT_51083 [Aspergillus novofumigatus IBT 16806]PKX99565.1 hypothetical protein P174DRAFT_51083 [Aspergillus novofumigatus IBT 16806]